MFLRIMKGFGYILSGQLQVDVFLILQQLKQGEIEMVQGLDDVNAALAQVDAELGTVTAALASLNDKATVLVEDVKALKAKATPDLTPAVDKILADAEALRGVSASVATAVASVDAADAEATG